MAVGVNGKEICLNSVTAAGELWESFLVRLKDTVQQYDKEKE
jgi:hypothetical protein